MRILAIVQTCTAAFWLAGCGVANSSQEWAQDVRATGRPPGADLHKTWDDVLRKHVDQESLVNYKSLKGAQRSLDEYLSLLAQTDPATLNTHGKLAYWINAYNAFTLKLIVEHYPVKSIKDIPRCWETKNWNAGGKMYSLNQIEHEILRKDFEEPRIHFAIVCASIGCPNLWDRAFTEDDIGQQLTEAGKKFFSSPKHFRFETQKSVFGGDVAVMSLSKILKWFKEDFTNGGKQPVTDFVLQYVDSSVANRISNAEGVVKIKYLSYDWGLNEK